MSRPLRSTPTPASRSFTATTSRSASERRIGTQRLRVCCLGALPLATSGAWRPGWPYRRSPSPVPCKSRRPGSRHLHAGHHLARNAGTRQAHHEGSRRTPAFDAIQTFRRVNGGAHRSRRFWNVFLVPPDAMPPQPRLSLIAHHDGLQPTRHQGGLAPTPQGRRRSTAVKDALLQPHLLQRSGHTQRGYSRFGPGHPSPAPNRESMTPG
jgi:hypothetical protein